jgi:hypothetical protein
MTDLRARLENALAEHFGISELGHRSIVEFVEALPSLPGIAVVELPEPDYENHWDIPSCGEFNGIRSTGDSVISVEIAEEGIEPHIFGEQTPLESRLFAAALLAAANTAEQQHD